MKIVKMALQVLGILLLIPAVGMATLRFDNRNADGPSILFPGGELVSGELHTGPEPNWRFVDDIFTVELQLNDPLSSRLIFILQNVGKIYIASGYMSTTLGRLWKHWAVDADEGDGDEGAEADADDGDDTGGESADEEVVEADYEIVD